MPKKRRVFGYQIPGAVTVNVAWVLGILLVIWVGWTFYMAFESAAEVSKINSKIAAIQEEKRVQEEIREELEARARIMGVEMPRPPTPEPGAEPTREVLTPSKEALLKEEMRHRRLLRPDERIISLPDVETEVPTSLEGPLSPGYTPRTPLEAWKLILGLSRAGHR